MVKSTWQDHFRSSITNAESLYSKDSTEVSLLMFCLRSRMIPINEYLDWAKENFELPILTEGFFKHYPPQKEFYSKWQDVYHWNTECLPVAEWDGVLFVACLEKPIDYSNAIPTVFLLTSHVSLDAAWGVYQKSERSDRSGFTDMTALAATIIATPTTTGSFFNQDGSLNLQDPETPEEVSENTERISAVAIGENEDSPEGLLADIKTTLGPMDSPTVIDAAPPQETTSLPIVPQKGPRSVEPLMDIPDSTALEESTKIDAMVPVEDDSDPAVPLPSDKQINDSALPSAPMKPTTLPGGTAAYLLEKVRKQNQEQFDTDIQAGLQQLKTFFTKSMLLGIGDKDRLIKPLVWDKGFENPPTPSPEFNLKTPSIFKIVCGTQKPYHGYVIVNDLNESFFEAWNHGQIPDHVTIVPIIDGDLVVGMLMGFGEKSSYNKNVLQFTEKIAKELSQKILKTPLQKAAA